MNVFLFLFVLISPTILYLAAIVLFPADFVDNLLKSISHLVTLGPLYFISSILFFAGLVITAITRNERYPQWYAIFFLAQTTLISFNSFSHVSLKTFQPSHGRLIYERAT